MKPIGKLGYPKEDTYMESLRKPSTLPAHTRKMDVQKSPEKTWSFHPQADVEAQSKPS